jgi:hypothetical protein
VIRFLRRFQPRNPVLAVLYWLVLAAVAVAALWWIFSLLPVTPFDQPSF